MLFEQAGEFIINKLHTELPAHFAYHQVDHTLDVYSAARRIGLAEGVNEQEMKFILTAAWFHDTGYLFGSEDHEERSCGIAAELLPGFEYAESDIETICGLIMATRLPQVPRNHLEQILADADLDYLGRNDFDAISAKLYRELKLAGKVSNEHEWNFTQVKFMEAHHYFTQTAINSRDAQKGINLAKIKRKIINAHLT